MTPETLELARYLAAAKRVLVFTGAGISTGSGIPDFRGPEGVWKTRAPVYYDEFLASEAKRVEYWEYKAESWDGFADAQPNAAHTACVTLARRGRLQAVVTQNIDGLHQAAGLEADRVIELHGTNRFVECVTCKALLPPGPVVGRFRATRRGPTCTCGGFLKFATISFGQALDPVTIERAVEEAQGADLVVALGSTLSVHPAASIPLVAVKAGAPYVVVNQGNTDHDALCTLRIEGDVARIFPDAVATLEPA